MNSLRSVFGRFREGGGPATTMPAWSGRLRDAGNRLRGLTYVVSGQHPATNVSDDILADRVRSSIGTLEKHLGVPRVHVMIYDHVATLHGEVGSGADAVVIEDAVRHVAGVKGVESHLHIGLDAGSRRRASAA